MGAQKILSGEVASKRAKRVLYPLLIVYLLNFVSSVVRSQITGYSGFTSGTPDPAGYSVVEHGHTIHVSAGQYWFGHAQIIVLVIGAAAWFIARGYFFRTGDLKRESGISKNGLEPTLNA
jgi:hypothetical protein